jgi:jumonji domain-containing protein 2
MRPAPSKIPVLHATWADMNGSFEAFIEKHERRIAAVGLAKVVPPAGWTPRKEGYPEDMDCRIERCIKQVATGSRGLYRFLLLEQKPMSLKDDFRPEALADDNQPGTSEQSEVERKYWRTITLRSPKYGADISGSLFDEDCKVGSTQQRVSKRGQWVVAWGISLHGTNVWLLSRVGRR